MRMCRHCFRSGGMWAFRGSGHGFASWGEVGVNWLWNLEVGKGFILNIYGHWGMGVS